MPDVSTPPGGDGWSEWGRHVLSELERLGSAYEGLRGEIQKIHVEIAQLKVKSGMWGVLGGLIPVVIALGIGIALYFAKGGK